MFATSLGWMMGPWLVFASLLNGASMAVLADVPTMANVGHLIETHRVTQLGIVPSMVRGWRKLPYEPRDWSSIRCYFSTGEASQFEDYAWLSNNGQVPVIEYCGGTEIGGGYISGSLVQEQRLCKFSTPCLGVRVWLRDDFDDWVPHGEEGEGEVFLEGPSLGLSETLLNYDHDKVYFSNIPEVEDDPSIHLRRHGDRLVRDADGYWQACGRCDDTMNLGGIKISSLEIERVCNPHPAVLESAAVSMAEGGRSGGPEDLYLFLVVKSEEEAPHTEQEWAQLMGRQVKEHLNPLFKVKGTKIVNMLPRTSTNKIMRRKLRDQLRSELQSVEEEKA
jgi:acyl-coenzyme A synthetase/AMP-(fatty) acid ligase